MGVNMRDFVCAVCRVPLVYVCLCEVVLTLIMLMSISNLRTSDRNMESEEKEMRLDADLIR